MTSKKSNSISSIHVKYLILDMSDCYTWSFPEFIPFCTQLYYFSSFKAFKTLTQAWWLQDLGLLFLYVFQHTALVYALKNNKAMTIWSDGKPVSSMDFQLAYNRTIVYYLTVLMHQRPAEGIHKLKQQPCFRQFLQAFWSPSSYSPCRFYYLPIKGKNGKP